MENVKNIPEKLLKPYNPQETEPRIYKLWEESGFFNPETCIEKGTTEENAKPFTIMMPPPNVTGVLHMGHAMATTLQDIMIRYHRMKGDRTLYLPGTDHAAIATQSKVEKDILKKEGLSRYDLGREEFLKRVEKFAKESHDTIVSQIKSLGASCDWSREAFTFDEPRNFSVRTMFKKMYDDGLIYRGERIVNWDPKGQTTIADDEIVYEERTAKLYTFKYSKDFPISISTTRPETKVGDTAVAVHPEDPRYQEYIGKTYVVENFCGVPLSIKIIADKEVEKDFGTGALGVTPAHSGIDWEIAERHNLPKKTVINEFAKITVGDERILNKKTTVARDAIVEWLRNEGLLEKEEDTKQNVATAERTGGIIEPLPKLQWWVNVNKPLPDHGNKTLKDLMREPVLSGKIKIIPDYFGKTYSHWIDNLKDWCISRQIWYGHRIPVWYRKQVESSRLKVESELSENKNIYIGVEPPQDSENWEQDPDTLDTWFSSGLWTFSTLGWPKQTKDLDIYHPTDVLETGYEIIFFWVARMILMTEYALKTIPFHTVYFNGTVRDAKGQKMSKSLGNGMDPLDVARDFGSDAGRMALIVGTAPGTDSKIDINKIKAYKHFANKLWNITRFILENTGESIATEINSSDEVHLNKWKETCADITKDMDEFRFYLAGEKIYRYVWHELADILLEESKLIFKDGESLDVTSRQKLLSTLLQEILIVLHPFMPFVTEEIWNLLPENIGGENLLMVSKWPTVEND